MKQVKMGAKLRVDPGNPKYEGVYRRYSGNPKSPIATFYIKLQIDGKQKFIRLGRAPMWTKTQAKNERAERIAKYKREGIPGRIQGFTFERMFNNWLPTRSKDYAIQCRSRYKNHIKPTLGHKPLHKITHGQINDLTEELLKTLQEPTVAQVQAIIRGVYKHAAKKEGYTGHNPWPLVDKVSMRSRRERILTKEQVDQLIERLKSHPRKDLYYLACIGQYTGARPIELNRLCKMDINLAGGWMNLRSFKGAEAKPKVRPVVIIDKLRPIIDELLKERMDYSPTEPLFRGKFPWQPFQKVFAPYNEGIEGMDAKRRVSFYTLRHSFATWLIQNGESMIEVKELMGHEDIATTAIYTKVTPAMQKSAMDRLNESFD